MTAWPGTSIRRWPEMSDSLIRTVAPRSGAVRSMCRPIVQGSRLDRILLFWTSRDTLCRTPRIEPGVLVYELQNPGPCGLD